MEQLFWLQRRYVTYQISYVKRSAFETATYFFSGALQHSLQGFGFWT